MDHRNGEELEAPLLESAPLPEKRRSTFLTVCPFILGRGQILWQLFSLMHSFLRVAHLWCILQWTSLYDIALPIMGISASAYAAVRVLCLCIYHGGVNASEVFFHFLIDAQAMSSVRDWPSMGKSTILHPPSVFVSLPPRI